MLTSRISQIANSPNSSLLLLALRAEHERREREREKNKQQTVEANALTFREFVNKINPRYRWYRHCEVLADVLQKVADGEIKRLMLFTPPRHGKSETVSRLFTAYF